MCEQLRVLRGDTRQAREGAEGTDGIVARESISATQHPLAFKHDGVRNIHACSLDQLPGAGRLLGMIASDKPDQHTGVNRQHAAAELPPEFLCPWHPEISGGPSRATYRKHPLDLSG